MKLMKQNLGAHWVIGIKGNKDEIEQFHNRVYNWGRNKRRASMDE